MSNLTPVDLEQIRQMAKEGALEALAESGAIADYVSQSEAARRLKIGRRTLYDWIQEQRIGTYGKETVPRVSLSEIRRAMRERMPMFAVRQRAGKRRGAVRGEKR